MGKTIKTAKATVTTWIGSHFRAYDAYGAVLLRECDDDTLNKVELVIAAHFLLTNTSSSSVAQATNEYIKTKFTYGGVAHIVQVNGTTVQAGSTAERYNESVLDTFYRTDTEQVITGLLGAAKNDTPSGGTEVTLIVPPYKQNAVKDGRRIVTKVNGVEYDLRNYK